MARHFTPKIPKKPRFRRDSYEVPENYSQVYEKEGVTNSVEQVMLFHVTQFGGFKVRRIPKYMKERKEFMSRWFKVKREYGHYTVGANPDFLAKFGNIKIKPLRKIWNGSAVNEQEMHEYGFTDEEIRDSEAFLYRLNRFYSRVTVGISIPDSGITLQDRIHLTKFHGTPFLVKKPKAGGRFFNPGSSWQRIASSLRRLITINGENTSEVDISAATLQFLGIALEYQLSNPTVTNMFSQDDPYQYFLERLNSGAEKEGREKIDRDDVKTLVYTTVFSAKNRQKSSLAHKLKILGLPYRHSDISELFPEFFEALEDLKTNLEPPPHVVIFREESRYAQKVLEKACLELALPVIPIHDSFMSPKRDMSKLKKIMDGVSKELYERKLKYKVKY